MLKILALLLFTLEIFTPVFLTASSANASDVVSFTEVPTKNLILSILAEEAGSEGEREGKDHKYPLDFSDFTFSIIPYPALIAETKSDKLHLRNNHMFDQPVLLFQLHQVYLV